MNKSNIPNIPIPPEGSSLMAGDKTVDFDKELQRLATESFNKGVETICESIITVFRRIAITDTAEPRTFTAVDVIRILKPVQAGAMLILKQGAGHSEGEMKGK